MEELGLPICNKKTLVILHFFSQSYLMSLDSNKIEKKPFYQKGKYSVTINPNNTRQYIKSRDRMQSFRDYMHEKLMVLKVHGISYTFFIEISEGLQEGADRVYNDSSINRLHLHGVIDITHNSSIKWLLLNGLKHLQEDCYIKISKLTDEQGWLSYCTKQQYCIKEEPLTNKYTTPKKTQTHNGILEWVSI